MTQPTKQNNRHADECVSSMDLQALFNSSFSSLVLYDSDSTPRNNTFRTDTVCDIIDAVQDILGWDDIALEPTPIAPHRAQIVDQVHVTENSWHDDEAFLLLLNPLLTKRKIEESAQELLSKRRRMTNTKTTTTAVAASISSIPSNNSNDNTRIRGYQAELWSDRYEDLVAFRETHGHCLVPHKLPENPALAQWVKRQRYQHKLLMSGQHSTLTEERIMTLESLGFVWDSHRAAWEERLDELRLFKAKHGHCNVPANFQGNPTLAVWIKCQRRQRRLYQMGEPSNINEERIQKLDSLGFLWNPRKGTE